ncbi:MAG: PaaI family thioesterase [Clostridia bacterium]|nr:PaaI family thioesterase [Clostridia bacterium]
MSLTAQAKRIFSADLYATHTTGIELLEAEESYCKCRLQITQNHLNAAGFVMGGAIFTLADFTFAVASNLNRTHTVSLDSHIQYLRASKGPVLLAEARPIKEGKSHCFYQITVSDGEGKTIALVNTAGFRKESPM